MYTSKETRGFYESPIRDGMVEISREEVADLRAAEDQGKAIDWGDDDYPFLFDPPPPVLTLEQVQALRLAAYRAESDPLKVEAEYDAQLSGAPTDYSAWLLKVTEIKERYPLPPAE